MCNSWFDAFFKWCISIYENVEESCHTELIDCFDLVDDCL